jgi:hypothetical protein
MFMTYLCTKFILKSFIDYIYRLKSYVQFSLHHFEEMRDQNHASQKDYLLNVDSDCSTSDFHQRLSVFCSPLTTVS